MENNKKKQVTFNTFLDVKCPALKAWNQLQFALSLEQAHGEAISSKYFEMLSEAERTNVMLIGTRITVKGEEFVKREVMNYNN